MSDLENLPLPKWPQMLVWGESVTKEQAYEIIRRTDNFFEYGDSGNDIEFSNYLKSELLFPKESNIHNIPGYYNDYFNQIENWKYEWDYIETEYVRNSWILCSYIYGPHGWCHPDGTIQYIENIGKWPSISEVLRDWKTLATEFDFLDLYVVLMSGSGCEENIEPVVGIRVKKGIVKLFNVKKFFDKKQELKDKFEEIRKIERDISKYLSEDYRRLDKGMPEEALKLYFNKAKEIFDKENK